MAEQRDLTEVLGDISVLYELSLSVGASLDLQETCDVFLRTLIARKNLDYAAVWARNQLLRDDPAEDGLTLVYGNPMFRRREWSVPPGHIMARDLGDGGVFTVGAGDPAFPEWVTEKGIESGRFAVLRLGDVGVLKLHSSTRQVPFERWELNQLRHVADKFAVAVAGCLAHRRAIREIDRRRKMECALRAVVEGTASRTGAEFFRALVGDLSDALEVRMALVTEVVPGPLPRARTIASFLDGGTVPDAEFDLSGSSLDALARGRTTVLRDGPGNLIPAPLRGLGLDRFLGVPMLGVAGTVLGYLAVLHDASLGEETHAVSILRIFAVRASAELQRIRAEEERQRLEVRVRHVQKLESLDVLAGGVAHDFNHLLTGILGNARLARRLLGDESPAGRTVEQVEKSALRAAELCRQLVAYSGKAKLSIEPLDLDTTLRGMMDLLEVSRPDNVRMEYELPGGLPAVDGDVTQVRQLVMDLVTNAAEAIGVSGGVVTLRTGAGTFDASWLLDTVGEALAPGKYVFFEVADTGIGMDAETKSRIFDPFFTTKFTGRGLGLAVVLGIVRGHRGAIRIDSRPGRGTTFRVLFPPSSNAPVSPPPAMSAPDGSG